MITLILSPEGQLTLPKEVQQALHLHPGSEVQGTIDDQGRLVLAPALLEPEEFLRRRPAPKRTVSLEQIEDGIREGASRGRF
jgi:bifunctional DNA-binding transcriptional regulator/antitoxin component of YhaV-PrlF toxin-antitoxin module